MGGQLFGWAEIQPLTFFGGIFSRMFSKRLAEKGKI